MNIKVIFLKVIYYQVRITVKSSSGSNSDIGNQSNLNLVLLRMLSEYIYKQDITIIWQISCWKQMAWYCTQKWLKSWTKTYLPMFLTRIQSQQTFCVVRIDVWMLLHLLFWHKMSLQQCIFHKYFHNFPQLFRSGILCNVLKLNQPIKWIVSHDLLPQMWNEKASLIGWGEFMVSCISDCDGKIASDLASKSATENIIATQCHFCHWHWPDYYVYKSMMTFSC